MSYWNAETAEWYAEKYRDYPTNRLAVNELDLLDHSSIVDVGCGTGSALRHAASITAGGVFIGIDPVPRMIEIAKELTEEHEFKGRIEYRVGSAEKLPIDNDFARYVFAFDSIDHWQDVDKGFREIKRILQPDGLFTIVKDKSVPGANIAIKTLIQNVESAGFKISNLKEITREEISFLLMICSPRI
jgi:ubiquinone/menaquinone biosynthesis C-methylase UbiE